MRAEVLKFEQINEYLFAKFLMPPVNKPSFQKHLKFLQRPGSWATQVEVVTVATMFQVPVYYCKSSQDGVYECITGRLQTPLNVILLLVMKKGVWMRMCSTWNTTPL